MIALDPDASRRHAGAPSKDNMGFLSTKEGRQTSGLRDAHRLPAALLIALVGVPIAEDEGEDGLQEAGAVALLQAGLVAPVVPGVPVPQDVGQVEVDAGPGATIAAAIVLAAAATPPEQATIL